MKTMTCKQMGGPCDEEFSGETLDQIVAMGSEHVSAATDEEHKAAQDMMAEAQKDPAKAAAWFKEVSEKFASMQTM